MRTAWENVPPPPRDKLRGFEHIARKFDDGDAFGPVTVRRFLSNDAA